MAFSGLTQSDFEAYALGRASSNAFVRPRIVVKEKLTALLAALTPATARLGLTLEQGASDERPSIWNNRSVTEQWVYLWRDRDERMALEKAFAADLSLGHGLHEAPPWKKHPTLALVLDAGSLSLAFSLFAEARGDVLNLQRSLQKSAIRETVETALRGLGSELRCEGLGPDAVPADSLGEGTLEAHFQRAGSEATWHFRLAARISAENVVALGDGLPSRLESLSDRLVSVYALLAWRRERDDSHLAEDMAKELATRAAHTQELAEREARWQAEHAAELEKQRQKAAEDRGVKAADNVPASVAVPAPKAVSQGGNPGVRVHVKPVRRDAPKAQSSKGMAVQQAHAPVVKPAERALVPSDGPIVLGARVRVLRGPFVGKEGTVLELDPHGNAKIQMGALATRVESGFLVRLA